MANTIKLKRASSSDPGASDLSVGELAIRTSNCKLFSKNDSGSAVGIVAGSADVLTTARTIAGVSFDGSANIALNNNAITNGAGYIADLVSDSSPQLGGDLDMNSRSISSGILNIKNTGSQSEVRLYCEVSNAHYISLKAPAHSTYSGNLTYTLPPTVTNGYFLQTNASGVLSWAAVDLTALSATNLTSGTIPDARFPSTLPAVNGSALTNLNGSNIASGTVAAARVATLNQDTTGTAAIATTVTVADESSDTSCNVLFATAATGNLAPKSGTNLTFNSSSGVLTATGFAGALTGNVTGNASGSSGSCTGNAATATALETARTIAGVSFDGSANISLNNNAITNGAGYLTSVATSNIADDAVTYAKIQNVSATNRILGRDSSGAGVIEEITPANLRTMLNVEDGATADQTNSEIAAALSDQRPSIRGADFTDDGTGSPIVHIKGDDGNPWGLIVGNDTYSTSSHGFAIYVDNNGDIDSRSRGNSEYRTWNIKQDDGSTVRALVTLSNDGSVYLRHQGNLKLGTSSSGVSVTGTCTATTFSGSGASLTSLPAGNLTGTLPAIDGSNLTGISAGATGGGSDEIFYENGQNVTTDYTITNGKNAMAAGPITIDSGATVTVGSGETLTIV